MYPGPSLQDYRQTVDRANSHTVLCTGRLEKVRTGVDSVLALHGLEFDELILKPNDKERYSRTNVSNYKRNVMATLLKKFPSAKEVNFWDDRVDNIEAIESMKNLHRNVNFNLYHIKERGFPKDLTTSTVFAYLGLMQDAKFKMAVEEVVGLLRQAWNAVLDIPSENTQELVHFFGSYLIERRSDVDVCLLAPTLKSPDECISSLASKLREYGFQFVYEATGIRCPRLKLKAIFCNHASVIFDFVVACVLPPLDSSSSSSSSEIGEMEFQKLYKICTDKKSKIALDGVLFAERFLIPVLDRISESEFGMMVNAVVLLLQRCGLKGNSFHCIRTFHIVKMLINFVNSTTSGDVIFMEDLDVTKNFEKVLSSALRYFASMSVESYRALFKSFVADSFIQPLIDCFARSAKLSLFDILFTGPRLPEPLLTKVCLRLCGGQSRIDQWKTSTLFEARFGTFARNLIDRGFSITPGQTTEVSISFAVDLVKRGREEFMTLLKGFTGDFEMECRGKSISLSFTLQ